MTDHKFTDEEIEKTLECCSSYDCDGCPLYSPTINCVILLPQKALELVKRQKAEIKRLNKEVDRLSQCVLYHDGIVSDLEKDLFDAKAEAIKEFAERLKSDLGRIPQHQFTRSQIEWSINTFVKEMTEDENEKI